MNSPKSGLVKLSTLPLGARHEKRFTPIVIVECYLTFTVLLFAFGPWPWDVRNPVTLYTYLFLVQAALFLGYWSVISRSEMTAYTGMYSYSGVLKFSVLLNLAAIIPFYYIQLGRLRVSFSAIWFQIVAGATDPGRAYRDILDAPLQSPHFILLWIYMLLTPILWLSVPLAIENWRSISLRIKAAVVFIVLANVATWIAIGTIQGIADNAGIVALSLLGRKQRIQKRLFDLRSAAAIVCALSVVVFYFSYAQNSRTNGRIITSAKGAGITLDSDSILISAVPDEMQAAVARGCSYLTSGYYGLSLALEVPFRWTFGVGHSLFLSGVVEHLTGFSVTNLTYPARVEEHFGWNMDREWDSVYPWLASDATFPGTVLLMFIIGRLLASVWRDAQLGENPFALPLFVIVMMMILYFPANDKILTNAYSVGAFWGLLVLWFSTSMKIRKSAR